MVTMEWIMVYGSWYGIPLIVCQAQKLAMLEPRGVLENGSHMTTSSLWYWNKLGATLVMRFVWVRTLAFRHQMVWLW